jgi:hypothetical protein
MFMVAGLLVGAASLGRLAFCTLMQVKQWWRCFFRVSSLGGGRNRFAVVSDPDVLVFN